MQKYKNKIKRPSIETMIDMGEWNMREPECKHHCSLKKKADADRMMRHGKMICIASILAT